MNIILLTKTGVTIQKTINSCTNFEGVNIINNIYGKTAKERWNEDLQAYIFTEDSYNKTMEEAEKYKLF